MKKALLVCCALAFSSLGHGATEDWKKDTEEYVLATPELSGYLVTVCVESDCMTLDRRGSERSYTDVGALGGSILGGMDDFYSMDAPPKNPDPDTGKGGGISKFVKDIIRGVIDGGGVKTKASLKLEVEQTTKNPDGTEETTKVKLELEGASTVGGAPKTP